MITYCEQVDLPVMPDEFLLSEDQILHLQRLSPDSWWQQGYGSFYAGQEIHDFLQPYFQRLIAVRYQLITKDRPFHIDACKQTFKYNYVYKTGGQDVKTIWDPSSPFTVVCEINNWYKLNVAELHCVKGITSSRCSITVKEEV